VLHHTDSEERKFYDYIKSMFAAHSTAIMKARAADPVLPRNMDKLVAKRKKEKIARSQLIVNNQELQRQLLDTTAAHQREIGNTAPFILPRHTRPLHGTEPNRDSGGPGRAKQAGEARSRGPTDEHGRRADPAKQAHPGSGGI